MCHGAGTGSSAGLLSAGLLRTALLSTALSAWVYFSLVSAIRVRTRRLRSLLYGIANSLRLDGRPNAHDRAGPRTDARSEYRSRRSRGIPTFEPDGYPVGEGPPAWASDRALSP
jgi:hypothetical protein